jgi:hypothetical protein
MGFVPICLLTTGALATTKVLAAPVAATNMFGVGWVDDGKETTRSAVASRWMDVLGLIHLALFVKCQRYGQNYHTHWEIT